MKIEIIPNIANSTEVAEIRFTFKERVKILLTGKISKELKYIIN